MKLQHIESHKYASVSGDKEWMERQGSSFQADLCHGAAHRGGWLGLGSANEVRKKCVLIKV